MAEVIMRVPLTNGLFALIDSKDYAEFGYLNWYAMKGRDGKYYAARKSEGPRRKTLYLAREILGLTDPKIKGDHINHDTLDCRRENLRPATNTQNVRNRKGANKNSKSGIRGVSWHPTAKKWTARIKTNRRSSYLGLFKTKEEASAAYAAANAKHFGEFGGNK